MDKRAFIEGHPANGPELSRDMSELKIAAERDGTSDLAASAPGNAAEFVRKQRLARMALDETGVGNHDEIDFAALQGFVIYASLLYVLAFLLVDLLYMFIDPRVRAS